MRKELTQVRKKKEKLLLRLKATQDELYRLSLREEELENQEIVAICRQNHITLEALAEKIRQEKTARRLEKKELQEDETDEQSKELE
ncbi:MAG: conjugal transfer protein [Dialister sp.]|nr:conjugal transfer protein [Dialister sp.]